MNYPSTSRLVLLLAAPLLALALLLSLGAPSRAQIYSNPIVNPSADPFITYQNGNYYLLETNLGNTITIKTSPSLATLGAATAHNIYNTGGFFESPELYNFNGLWYIYYTQYPSTVKVLESSTSDPLSAYHLKATLTTNTYDATVLQMPGGDLYLISSNYNYIVIQSMANPYTLTGSPVNLVSHTQSWEIGPVEGPEALWHNGQLDILYASGNYDKNNYGEGALHFNGGDPGIAANYTKLPGPIFTGEPSRGVYDAGVVSPFSSPDGTQTYFCYSDYKDSSTNDPSRCIMAQKMTFGPNNDPILGNPIGPGQAIALPSGDPNGPASAIKTGVYYRIFNQNSGLVASVNGSTTRGTNIVQEPDDGSTDNNWQLVAVGNGCYQIVNQYSGLRFSVAGSSINDAGSITQWTAASAPNLNWQIISIGGGYYHIVNQNSQKELCVNSGSKSAGARFLQYHDTGDTNHNWVLVPVGQANSALVSGGYYTLTNVKANLNIDDPGASTTPKTLQQLWDINGYPQQNWKLTQQTDGSFTLLNQAGGLMLDNSNASAEQGNLEQIYTANGGLAQEWRFNLLGDGNYTITNVGANLVLDDPGGSTTHGVHVQIYAPNNTTAQEWKLTRK